MNTVMIIVSVVIVAVAIIRLVAGIWFTSNLRARHWLLRLMGMDEYEDDDIADEVTWNGEDDQDLF